MFFFRKIIEAADLITAAAEAIKTEKNQAKALKKAEKLVKENQEMKDLKESKEREMKRQKEARLSGKYVEDIAVRAIPSINDKNDDDGSLVSGSISSIAPNSSVIINENNAHNTTTHTNISNSNPSLLNITTDAGPNAPGDSEIGPLAVGVDLKIDTEKRSRPVRISKKNVLDERSPVLSPEIESLSTDIAIIENDNDMKIEGESLDSPESVEKDIEKDEDDEDYVRLSVIIPHELTPNPDPVSYLPCVVYSMSVEEAYFSCCQDQVREQYCLIWAQNVIHVLSILI